MKYAKKLLILTALSSITMTNTAFTSLKNGKVLMIVTLEVKNFTVWKKMFDSGASVRENAGVKVISISTSLENENQIVVIEEAKSAQAAHDFLRVLQSKQKDGDMSGLDVKLYDIKE
ncbi:MAG: hypothetical protein V4561_02820 [Bacteroidota bacterium]